MVDLPTREPTMPLTSSASFGDVIWLSGMTCARREGRSHSLTSRPDGLGVSGSLRSFCSRVLCAGACRILAAVRFAGTALGFASAASAEVLVSNIGQTFGSYGTLLNTYDRAQGCTTGSNAAGYTLTSAVSSGETAMVDYTPPAVLAASVSNAPAEHRGKGTFAVRIAFSKAVAGKVRDAAATIQNTGGTLTRARHAGKRKDLWRLHIAPSGHAAVTLVLPATPDCAARGAVCTADGRRLGSALTRTVPGPVTLCVADARATEGEDANLDFAVTLYRAASGEVTARYHTKNGSAKAGRYTRNRA